ncbi:hypothetical protein [uncultured Ruminococcus sp.]|uniref:hypothetical protein n=1 Tax=uncultured Ruminococcus sp. TaxID=165186 RepID=UPI0026DC3AC3|nr:hypothetical protein [uncultured Ruminococcus sp.]
MTDKKDFNAEVYKNNVKNIKLSEKQKAELIKVMRNTEKQYKQNNVSHKVFNLKTGTAAAIAAVFVFVAIYAGFFKPNTERISSNKNIFTITANAAEIEDKSEIGVFSSVNGSQYLLKDFNNDDTIYRNAQGKTDYFNDFELTNLKISGKNIESVTFNSKRKGIYFLINSYINDNENTEDAEDGNSYNYYNSIAIAEIGDFSNYGSLDNSQYTKAEFKEHSDGLYGEFCDGFTFTVKNPSENEQEIKLDKAINLMVETDRTDSEIDNWADEYYRLDSELLSMRAKNCMSDDGEIQVTDEENALETKMENINNSILSKIVDGAEIDVSVQFTDGSVQSEKIRISYNNGNCGEEDNFPSITFRLV